MNFIKKILSYGLAGAIGAIISLGGGLLLLFFPNIIPIAALNLAHISYGLPFLLRDDIPQNEVVMVYMDDASHQELGPEIAPYLGGWDRSATHARLLERLTADGAKAAVFDIVFSDPSKPEKDEHFAKALKDFGKAIIAVDLVKAAPGREAQAEGQGIGPIFEPFLDSAAIIGTTEMIPDPDFVVRRHIPVFEDDLVTPLSWAAAQLLEAPITKTGAAKPKTNPAPRWINYYGPSEHLPNVSYFRALDTNEIKPGFFHNKIVFIGAKTMTKAGGERKDEYIAPQSLWRAEKSYMPGVEIQATLFLNLMRQDFLTRLYEQELLFVVLLGILFGVGLSPLRPSVTVVAGLAGVVVVTTLGYFLMTQTGRWISWAVMDVQIILAAVWSFVFNSILLFKQKALLQQSLGMYVSPSHAKQLSKRMDVLKPGAEKRILSVLFSDIANFTNMSEGMDPDDLARLMNRYFEGAVNECIYKTEGTVVKFIGDAIFAIWNAPDEQPDHYERACRGAILLRDNVTDFEFNKPGLEVRTRIGLHAGEASVGNFGSSNRVDYTAFGENINLTSRMEGLNKYVGTDILATGNVIKPVQHLFVTRFLGHFQLKGFAKAVEVYELIGELDKAAESKAYRDAFAQALKPFAERNWDEAEKILHCVLEMRPKDGPSKFYLKQIEHLRQEPPEADWQGEIELKEK